MKRTILAALIVLTSLGLVSQILPVLAQAPAGVLARRLRNGDINGDGTRDISDAVRLLNFFFQGGAEPVEITLESPSGDILAKVQAAAIEVVASLPTEAEIASMPPRIGRYLGSLQRRWSAAAADAPSWGLAQYEGFLGFVEASNESWPMVAERIQTAFPGFLDPECLEKCDLARLLCVELYQDPFGNGCDYDCETACDVEHSVCVMRCPVWSRLLPH